MSDTCTWCRGKGECVVHRNGVDYTVTCDACKGTGVKKSA